MPFPTILDCPLTYLLSLQMSPAMLPVLVNAMSEYGGGFQDDGRTVLTGGATRCWVLVINSPLLNFAFFCSSRGYLPCDVCHAP